MTMLRRGFTIIEVLITLVVIGTLLTLGFVSMTNQQAQARDKERESDIAAIARGLEWRYDNGNTMATPPAGESAIGGYPSNNEALHIDGNQRTGWIPDTIAGGYRTQVYKGTTVANFVSPSGGSFVLECVWACSAPGTASQVAAAVSTDQYVYSPVTATNGVCCCGGCVRYNLYYRSEVDGQIKTVQSKHR